MLVNAVLAGVVIIAVVYDLRVRRIPNPLIIAALVFAFTYHFYQGGSGGLIFSLKGFGLGLLLLLLPFLMDGMGAGDVKLLAAVGAIKGSVFVFNTFLWMALWGGLIALIILTYQRRVKETASRLKMGFFMAGLGLITTFTDSLSREEYSVYYPYGVAIALGVLSSCFKGWW